MSESSDPSNQGNDGLGHSPNAGATPSFVPSSDASRSSEAASETPFLPTTQSYPGTLDQGTYETFDPYSTAPAGGPAPQAGYPQAGYPQAGYSAAPVLGGYPAVGAYLAPVARYGYDPATGLPYSDKSKVAAGLLQLFLGGFGAGRFYMGQPGLAIGQIAATWLTGIGFLWPFIDGIVILAGKPRDSNGFPLR